MIAVHSYFELATPGQRSSKTCGQSTSRHWAPHDDTAPHPTRHPLRLSAMADAKEIKSMLWKAATAIKDIGDNACLQKQRDTLFSTLEDFGRADPALKRLLVIGCTGAGKSTLLNLMAGWTYVGDTGMDNLAARAQRTHSVRPIPDGFYTQPCPFCVCAHACAVLRSVFVCMCVDLRPFVQTPRTSTSPGWPSPSRTSQRPRPLPLPCPHPPRPPRRTTTSLTRPRCPRRLAPRAVPRRPARR